MKVVADNHIPYIENYFGVEAELVLKPGRAITQADLQDADLLIVRSITHVNQALLQHTPVKFVGSVTAGFDHLDVDYLTAAHIDWCVAAGFNAQPVADYVISVIAALQATSRLPEKNLKAAVIGVGQVGQRVVKHLQSLQIDTILCDPPRQDLESDFKSVSLDDIADVDIVLLHVPLVKSGAHPTFHFIDQSFLQRQKPGCVLINAGRGSVIQSADLLTFGNHLQWCFDVWEHEPHIDLDLLKQAAIATPHIAGYSVQSKIRGIDMVYRQACQRGFIKPQSVTPMTMPVQALDFFGDQLTWQSVVLEVFNPLVMTEIMKSTIPNAAHPAHVFDELRNQFVDRYEFGSTKLLAADVAEAVKARLTTLGIMT